MGAKVKFSLTIGSTINNFLKQKKKAQHFHVNLIYLFFKINLSSLTYQRFHLILVLK